MICPSATAAIYMRKEKVLQAFVVIKPHAVSEAFLNLVLREISGLGLVPLGKYEARLTQDDVNLLYPEFQDLRQYPIAHQEAVFREWTRGECIALEVQNHSVFELCARLKTKIRERMNVDSTIPANYIHCTDDRAGYIREKSLFKRRIREH